MKKKPAIAILIVAQALVGFDEKDVRCAICMEVFIEPVLLTSCSHTFCTLCVYHMFGTRRNASLRKAPCPVCKFKFSTVDIVPNLVARTLVEKVVETAPGLLELSADEVSTRKALQKQAQQIVDNVC